MTPEQIVELYRHRARQRGPLLMKMKEVRDAYYGDLTIPLPELDKNEKSGVPNLTATGIDQFGSRIGSTTPNVTFPPNKPGKKNSELAAANKRMAVFGWWDRNRIGTKLPRRGRHFCAYGMAPMQIVPNWDWNAPQYRLRHPLETFPSDSGDPDDITPRDCIFAYRKPYWWVRQHYPYQANLIARPHNCSPDEWFEILEYESAEWCGLLLVGKPDGIPGNNAGASRAEALEWYPNRTEVCRVVVPGRVTLERIAGQFDQMIGMHYWQARMFALEAIAVEHGIFPDQWLIARQNETPDIIQVADGRTGRVGVVKGGDFRDVQHQPGYMTTPTINYLERSQRLTGGIPAEFGGESPNNVRTGRRGENILSATIDFSIAEAQNLLAASMEAENKRAIAVDIAYHNTPKSFYVKWPKANGQVDYTPDTLFDSDDHVVSYSQAGTDVNGLVISGGQRVGMGTMSKRTFMERDPMVEDPELEHDRVTAEALEAALLQGLQAMAAEGQIPPADLAKIMQIVRSNEMDLADAVDKVQQEAQERQAEQVPPGDPLAQPGIAVPGAGAEATIGEPEASVTNLSDLLSQLRGPQARATPQEMAV
jgi:hypothetical protein